MPRVMNIEDIGFDDHKLKKMGEAASMLTRKSRYRQYETIAVVLRSRGLFSLPPSGGAPTSFILYNSATLDMQMNTGPRRRSSRQHTQLIANFLTSFILTLLCRARCFDKFTSL